MRNNDRLMPSVAFWLCLFVAAAMFAGVVLSPKLLIGQRLTGKHRHLQRRVTELEHTNGSLERVVTAFRNDPEFAAEVARLDFDAAQPGEQRLAVEPPRAFADPPALDPAAADPPKPIWWCSTLDVLATDQRMRNLTLITAAGLVIVAFGFFPVSSDSVK